MEEKKLTDEEIVKALECCKQNECEETCAYCSECPASDWDCEEDITDCTVDLFQKTINLIHRLQSENETLKTELRKECEEHEEFTKKAKEEIIEWNKLFIEQKAEIERLTEENKVLKIDVGRFLKKAVFYYRTCQSYGIENFYDEDLEPKGKEGKKITFPKFKDVEVE